MFVKVKTSCKWFSKCFSRKNPDQTMIMQLDSKGKKLKEVNICFQMFISFVWSIDFNYINKHGIYSNIHQKLIRKQQMQKSKLALPKRWKEHSFGYCRCLPGGRCLLGYSRCFTPVLFSHQFLLQDFTPVLNSVLNSATGSSYSLTSLCTSLLLVTGMLQYRKDRSCKDRSLKSKLTENLLLLVVEQNRPIIIISLVWLLKCCKNTFLHSIFFYLKNHIHVLFFF